MVINILARFQRMVNVYLIHFKELKVYSHRLIILECSVRYTSWIWSIPGTVNELGLYTVRRIITSAILSQRVLAAHVPVKMVTIPFTKVRIIVYIASCACRRSQILKTMKYDGSSTTLPLIIFYTEYQ